MKYIFTGIFAFLGVMSVAAWLIRPKQMQDGKIILNWTVDDNESRQEQAALFSKLYPRYDLRIDEGNMDMSKVIVQSIAGVGPDIFCCYSGSDLSAYVKAGVALDITSEINAMGIDLSNDVWNGANPCLMYDGRIYGIPNNVAVDALWFNKDLLDTGGVLYPTGPWTWYDFLPIAKKLTIRDDKGRVKQYGFMFEWRQWPMFMRQWGGRVYCEDGTRCILDRPETIAAVQFMQDLIYKHHVSPTPAQEAAMSTQGGWGSGIITLFGGGHGATALGGRYWLIALRRFKELRLGAVESPHGPCRVYHSYGKATLINRKSPRSDQALDFLKYMLRPEYNELINDQADGLGPVKECAYTARYLHNPDFPREDYNAVWRDIMQYAVAEQQSLFVNGAVANRIIEGQLDLVKNRHKTAAEAMREATRRINEEIEKTLERDPCLRKRYAAKQKGAT